MFQSKNIETIVPSVKIEGTNQYYFILSVLLKDDKQIRHKIKLVRGTFFCFKSRLAD